MSPEQIVAIFGCLNALVATLFGYLANRSRRIATDQRADRKELIELRRVVKILCKDRFALEVEIARLGGTAPEMPDEVQRFLLGDDDDDDRRKRGSGA